MLDFMVKRHHGVEHRDLDPSMCQRGGSSGFLYVPRVCQFNMFGVYFDFCSLSCEIFTMSFGSKDSEDAQVIGEVWKTLWEPFLQA